MVGRKGEEEEWKNGSGGEQGDKIKLKKQGGNGGANKKAGGGVMGNGDGLEIKMERKATGKVEEGRGEGVVVKKNAETSEGRG